EALGARRAATVRRMLIERGLPAAKISTQSAGNTEPVVDDCRGSKQELIACYAPNRRVVVRVEASRPA
ncbi:OmpA family protein, partial [Burkholderia ubonensis]